MDGGVGCPPVGLGVKGGRFRKTPTGGLSVGLPNGRGKIIFTA